jgi:hypothetical protein
MLQPEPLPVRLKKTNISAIRRKLNRAHEKDEGRMSKDLGPLNSCCCVYECYIISFQERNIHGGGTDLE